jgi:uncharacterized protein
MRIGILSDIHDNIWALEAALDALRDVDALFGLGDYCAPFTVAAIGEAFAGPVHLVWGNNDGDKVAIVRNAASHQQVIVHGEWARLKLGGRAIALVHDPGLGEVLAQGGRFDLVCHGHNHQRSISSVGDTLLVNPGEVMGRFGVRSVAVYDTEAHQAEIITL